MSDTDLAFPLSGGKNARGVRFHMSGAADHFVSSACWKNSQEISILKNAQHLSRGLQPTRRMRAIDYAANLREQ